MKAFGAAVLTVLVLAIVGGGVSRSDAIPPPPDSQQEFVVASPRDGLLSLSDVPGGLPFVKVGDRVKSGALLALVDNMPVRAMFSGTVIEIMAQEEMVEAGQPLFRIRLAK